MEAAEEEGMKSFEGAGEVMDGAVAQGRVRGVAEALAHSLLSLRRQRKIAREIHLAEIGGRLAMMIEPLRLSNAQEVRRAEPERVQCLCWQCGADSSRQTFQRIEHRAPQAGRRAVGDAPGTDRLAGADPAVLLIPVGSDVGMAARLIAHSADEPVLGNHGAGRDRVRMMAEYWQVLHGITAKRE